MIGVTAFITFPTLSLIVVLAEPLILFLLGEKWMPVVPLLQWLCVAKLVFPISVINMNILNAVGRSDLFLKVDLIKFPMVIVALIITIPISLEAVVIGQAVISFIAFFINAYLPGKLYGYGPLRQLKDLWKIILATASMVAGTYIIISLFQMAYLKILIGFVVALFIFITIAYLLKIDEQDQIKKVVKEKLWKKKSR